MSAQASESAGSSQLEQVFRLAPVGMLVVNESGEITMANPALAELFEFDSPEELIGERVEVLIAPSDRTRHVDLRTHFNASDTSYLMAGRAVAGRTRNGQNVPLEISLTALADSSGSTLAILNDLRSRLAVEDALRSHNEGLAKHNADLEQFARVVAHDLREPLRSIVGFAQLLEKEQESQSQLSSTTMEYIEFVVSGAYRMQALLDAMLRFARLNEPAVASQVDMNECLAAAIQNLKHQIGETNARIDAEHLPMIRSDPEQVVMLLQNLLSNSMKFCDGKVPEIRLSTRQLDSNWWEISHCDNGIGIEPKFHERAFEVFQRLHGDQYEGTGMGLAICRRIVTGWGGDLRMESRPSGGTCVVFTVRDF